MEKSNFLNPCAAAMAVIIIVMYLIEVSQFPTHEIVFGTNYNGDSALKETHKRVLKAISSMTSIYMLQLSRIVESTKIR